MFSRNSSVHDDAQMVKLFFQFLDSEFKQTIQCDEHNKMIVTKQQEMQNSSCLEYTLNINMRLERSKASKNHKNDVRQIIPNVKLQRLEKYYHEK